MSIFRAGENVADANKEVFDANITTKRAEDLRWLRQCLELWRIGNLDSFERARAYGATYTEEVKEGWYAATASMAKEAEEYLPYLLCDNSGRSADELQRIAGELSPGGTHSGGWLIDRIRRGLIALPRKDWHVDQWLLAATIYGNWRGGKAGFQFLPDPATVDLWEYEEEVGDLMDALHIGDPSRILTGSDLAFYDSLPDRFTIYRGCSGISWEQAAAGLCWTTNREIAEWFAVRYARDDKSPVLVSARVRKGAVRLAMASEFEVVVRVRGAKDRKCRRRSISNWRPNMQWSADGVAPV